MAFITFEAPIGADERNAGREPPPGRDLAASLLRALQSAGFHAAGALVQHDSYGWSFTVEASDALRVRRVWCMLQLSDDWLLITRTEVPLLRRLFGSERDAAGESKVDAALVAAASSTPGVSNVRWFRTEDDLRRGHAQEP